MLRNYGVWVLRGCAATLVGCAGSVAGTPLGSDASSGGGGAEAREGGGVGASTGRLDAMAVAGGAGVDWGKLDRAGGGDGAGGGRAEAGEGESVGGAGGSGGACGEAGGVDSVGGAGGAHADAAGDHGAGEAGGADGGGGAAADGGGCAAADGSGGAAADGSGGAGGVGEVSEGGGPDADAGPPVRCSRRRDPALDDDSGALLGRPCHLYQAGAPFLSMPRISTDVSFLQAGLLLRGGYEGSVPATRMVQYGQLLGIPGDAANTFPVIGVEYDVSAWPPIAERQPTELHPGLISDNIQLLELPNSKLALLGYVPTRSGGADDGTGYWRIDADSWAPELFRVLDKTVHGTSFAAPAEIVSEDDGSLDDAADAGACEAIAVAHYHSAYIGGGSAALQLYGDDGSPLGQNVGLWSINELYTTGEGEASLANTGSSLLVAVHPFVCPLSRDGGGCEPTPIVVNQLIGPGTSNPLLRKGQEILTSGSASTRASPLLLSDRRGHAWLIWRESGDSLSAMPLTDSGNAAGPTELWFTGDTCHGASMGPIGAVCVVSASTSDGGETKTTVQLLHRPLDTAEIEYLAIGVGDLRADYAITVQTVAPRQVIVGYANEDGEGKLVRYACEEDRPE